MPPEKAPNQTSNKPQLPKILVALCAVFFLTSVGMLLLWKPWQPNVKASDRIISVAGEAKLTATPDEYVYTPNYDFTDASSQTALAAMTAKSNEIVAKLKALGVGNNSIKTDSSGYSGGIGIYTPVRQGNGATTYTLRLTVTIDDNTSLAQKVQDYLVSTNPTGSVSPEVTFSDAKQKSLQDQARDQAEKDAHSKAVQSAKNLGFKLLAVKSVQDGSLGGPILPLEGGMPMGVAQKANSSLTLQPGENSLSYSVTVVYYIH